MCVVFSILPFFLSLQIPSKTVSRIMYYLSLPFPLLHTKGTLKPDGICLINMFSSESFFPLKLPALS